MATDRIITGSVAIFYLHNCQTRDFTWFALLAQYREENNSFFCEMVYALAVDMLKFQ